MSISSTVKTIQDIMRKDAGVDGDAQRINQLVWMFFLKIFDDREEEKELLEDNYHSPIPERLRWRNWAANTEGITGEALADFINNDLFKTLKNLSSPDPRAQLVRHVFEEANNYMKSGTLMRQVINKINEVDFNRKNDLHLFGDIYEQILRDLQSAGNAGEFYTPRAVTQFMVEMVDPKLGEKVLDPACGTGGFLTNTIEHVRKRYVHSIEDEQILQASIKGVEKKQLPYFLCVTNLMLHGIDTPNQVAHDNTLARPYRDYQPEDRVDAIVTNPPFGGMEEDGIEKNFPQAYSTRETADLFLVLIIHLLREEGRGAIVLPDGTLFGEGVKTRIKEKLLTECNLHTIVRLPNGVFSPYTGIKTNLLFFTKGKPTKEVWYYEHPYPPGVKSYNKTKPIRIEEFEAEKAWWTNRVESERAWRVSFETIAANNFNLDIKNPNVPDEVHGDFDELLAEHDLIMRGLAETRDTLKTELMKALQATTGGQSYVSLQTFFDNFALLADAPNGVQKLRELILQLAVQGKLVPQDPHDESASVLLEKITRAKTLLSKEKKVRQAELILSKEETEAPFQLPDGWLWARFGDVTINRDGERIPIEKSIRQGRQGIYDYYGASGVIDKIDDYLFDKPLLLIGEDGANLINRATPIAFIAKGKYWVNNHAHVLDSLSLACLEYLEVFINAIDLRRYITGTAQPKMNQAKMNSILVALAPEEEQKRIVAKVNQLLALCDELKNKLSQAEKDDDKLMNTAVQHVIASINQALQKEPLSLIA
jgi:type I restriction enzyme M protein